MTGFGWLFDATWNGADLTALCIALLLLRRTTR